MKKAIAYYRISKCKNGERALSIEAQIKEVADYASAHGYALEKEYVEIESGTKNHDSLLKRALIQCKRRKATLLVAKLDRMSRNVCFISGLMESKVDFKVLDIPGGEKFMMHIKAAFAEDERDKIAERTRLALRAAKARGVELGKHGRYVLSKQNRELSQRFAQNMLPTITRLKIEGFSTVRAIMGELNREKVPTYRNNGSKWHVSTVHKVISQIDEEKIALCIDRSKQQKIPSSPELQQRVV